MPSLVEAFNTHFKGEVDPAKLIKESLDDYAKKWHPDYDYFPGTSIIQSSGIGKSRNIIDLWKHGVFVFYCSFMSEQAQGYPRRTEVAKAILSEESEEDLQQNFIAYFAACIYQLKRYIEAKAEQDTKDPESNRHINKRAKLDHKTGFEQLIDDQCIYQVNKGQSTLWRNVIKKMAELKRRPKFNDLSKICDCLSNRD